MYWVVNSKFAISVCGSLEAAETSMSFRRDCLFKPFDLAELSILCIVSSGSVTLIFFSINFSYHEYRNPITDSYIHNSVGRYFCQPPAIEFPSKPYLRPSRTIAFAFEKNILFTFDNVKPLSRSVVYNFA